MKYNPMRHNHYTGLFVLVLLLILLASPGLVAARELPEPLQRALALQETQRSKQWSFIRETNDEEGHYIESYDPDMPEDERWTLLQFNGQPPSKKALKRYRSEYEDLSDRESPTDFDLNELMDATSIVLSRETEQTVDYEFQPQADDEEDAEIVRHLLGTLSIDKQSGHVRRVRIQNKRDFSPAAMVKITTLIMDVQFENDINERPRFLASASTQTAGKFMGFKKFAETENVIYRDFKPGKKAALTSIHFDKTQNESF